MSATNSLHYELCKLGAKFLKSRNNAEPWRTPYKYVAVELVTLAANQIIAQAALIRANMENKAFCDAVEHLIDNTIKCAILIEGIDGALKVQDMVENKREKIYEKL